MGVLEKAYLSSPVFLQSVILNAKALELYFERYGRKFEQVYEEFNRNQYLSPAELVEYQSRKLRQLVAHAYHTVPYYNRVFKAHGVKPADIDSIEDLHKLPVLTKQDINTHFNDMISTAVNRKKLRKGHTSGTTGTPLNLLYDIHTCVVHHVADRRQKEWAGMQWGQVYASLQGRVICPPAQSKPPFWRKNYINNQLFLSSFHLKKDYLQSYVDKLQGDGIEFLEGYPSTVYTLASFLNASGHQLPLKAVLTSSETLFDWQRSAIERAFDCRVFDFYGMAERVVYASECKAHAGHHLNSDYGISEFLDDDGRPVPVGQVGKIVATGLHNFAFPLIRYQTNDSCSLQQVSCDCGCSFPLMGDVATKNEAIITLPDGRWISPSVLTHPFKPMVNIEESQIIQSDLHTIEVKIVKKKDYSRADEQLLLKGLRDRLGDDVDIDISYVDSLERTRSGKFKWVKSAIKPNFNL